MPISQCGISKEDWKICAVRVLGRSLCSRPRLAKHRFVADLTFEKGSHCHCQKLRQWHNSWHNLGSAARLFVDLH